MFVDQMIAGKPNFGVAINSITNVDIPTAMAERTCTWIRFRPFRKIETTTARAFRTIHKPIPLSSHWL